MIRILLLFFNILSLFKRNLTFSRLILDYVQNKRILENGFEDVLCKKYIYDNAAKEKERSGCFVVKLGERWRDGGFVDEEEELKTQNDRLSRKNFARNILHFCISI